MSRSHRAAVDRTLDRDLTVQLVELTGRANLVFTVRDARAVMDETPRLRLTEPSALSRNVRRLVGSLIEEVGQGELLSDSGRHRKAPYRYVLRSRREEVARGELRMTDSEKVVAAVHVAARLWTEWVHTAAVTEVLRSVPDLALENPAQTSTCLNNLVRSKTPLIEKRNAPGSRWAEWRSSPEATVSLPVEEWADEYRARSKGAAPKPFQVGLPTLTRLCEDLVRTGVAVCRRQWSGGGRPVTAKDIEKIARTTKEGRKALEIIRRRGQSLAGALSNAARVDIPGGTKRKMIRVVRIDGPDGRTYYDLPDGQSGLRALYVDYKWYTRQASKDAVREFQAQARAVRPYLAHPSPGIQVIAAARHVLLLRRLKGAQEGLQRVISRRSHLRAHARRSLEDALARLGETASVLHHGIVELEAVGLIESAGFDPEVIADRARPLVTAHECVEWLAGSQVRGSRLPSTWQ